MYRSFIHQCIDHWLCRPRGRECPLRLSDQEATEACAIRCQSFQHLREEDTWPLTPLICAVAPIKNCSTTPRSVLCITWKCTSQACAKHMHSSWNSDYSHCLLFHLLLHCMASDEIHQCIDHWLCRPRGRECPLRLSDQEATEACAIRCQSFQHLREEDTWPLTPLIYLLLE